ncbi:hypothetical protein T492DRAFT_871619 [Pavlovales sp. CCMP2436]|nr:hypothetical protein T492DRAFT_871619 [Pavlovales sp. CCMP2436]
MGGGTGPWSGAGIGAGTGGTKRKLSVTVPAGSIDALAVEVGYLPTPCASRRRTARAAGCAFGQADVDGACDALAELQGFNSPHPHRLQAPHRLPPRPPLPPGRTGAKPKAGAIPALVARLRGLVRGRRGARGQSQGREPPIAPSVIPGARTFRAPSSPPRWLMCV